MPLNNFGLVWVAPGMGRTARLFRCAQPDADGMKTLAALGVRRVFKLNDAPEPETSGPLCLSSYPLPSFFFDPQWVRDIAAAINAALTNEGSVVVHCTHGRDRTGLVIGAWRLMFCGWTLDQVKAEQASYGVVGLDEIADLDLTAMLTVIAAQVAKGA